MRIEKELPGIKKNILLKNYTTFKIGGRAKYFFLAKNKAELIKAIKVAQKFNVPFFILGGGSNILVSDKGFNGLVIKFGQPLSDYLQKGLEWAVGIPGTIQGAVFGNAGAFKKSMKDFVKEVEVFDTKEGKVKIFKNRDCHFSYRNSIFKKKRNLIILSVKIKSKKSNPKKIKDYLSWRKKNQPLNLPSAGSIFKNPSALTVSHLKNKLTASRLIKEDESPFFTAAQLIEASGLKGKKIGQAQISKKQANFIVNLGGAQAKDVKKLINLVKRKVKNKFKIDLKEEIEYLGF